VIRSLAGGLPPQPLAQAAQEFWIARPQGLSPAPQAATAFRNAVIERIAHLAQGESSVPWTNRP